WRNRWTVYYIRTASHVRQNLLLLGPLLSLLVAIGLVSSFLLSIFESAGGGAIRDWWAAAFVTLIAMTTVGLGDLYPVTAPGRVLVVVDGLIGLVLFGIVVWLVTKSLDD